MITLNDLFNLNDLDEYTICLNNDIEEDVCSLLDPNETPERKASLTKYISWKKSNGINRHFRKIDTPKCLQFLRIRGTADKWLFLGAFKCMGFHTDGQGNEIYDLERISDHENFSERLIVTYCKSSGDKQAKLNWDRYLSMEVCEIMPDIFTRSYRPFPGYDSIRLSFPEMKRIFNTPYRNWQDALSVINGIYVIADSNTGKLYVGSTYGTDGLWNRWKCYVNTNGHGGDKDLKALTDADPDYADKYFRFTLIEYFFNIKNGQDNKEVIKRESFWKEALLARSAGYNNN
ncbi:MAG: GIY-YIG nuclease family protein [Clostridiales bacterium]|nr:GIY-YIG nuclease family protein [Clostridiales bacterium]